MSESSRPHVTLDDVTRMLKQVAVDRNVRYWTEGHPGTLEAVEVWLSSLRDHLANRASHVPAEQPDPVSATPHEWGYRLPGGGRLLAGGGVDYSDVPIRPRGQTTTAASDTFSHPCLDCGTTREVVGGVAQQHECTPNEATLARAYWAGHDLAVKQQAADAGSTPKRCEGSSHCTAPLHVHGCYADLDGSACEDPTEHTPTTPDDRDAPPLVDAMDVFDRFWSANLPEVDGEDWTAYGYACECGNCKVCGIRWALSWTFALLSNPRLANKAEERQAVRIATEERA